MLRSFDIHETSMGKTIEMWSGPGNCHFTGASVLDPWHRLPVKNMIAATYSVGDFILAEGKVLETL